MNRHLRSLLLSAALHVTLLAAIYFSYTTIKHSLVSDVQHPCGCCSTTIRLSAIKTEKLQQPQLLPNPKKISTTKNEKPQIKQDRVEHKKKVVEKKIVRKETTFKQVETKVEPKKLVEAVAETNTTNVSSVENQKDTHCNNEVIAPKIVKKEDANKEYLSLHVTKIISLLQENLYYPRRARKRGIEGVVQIRFTLHENGKITNIYVLKSDYEILTNAAKKTIESLDEKLPKPSEILKLTIPIEYRLK